MERSRKGQQVLKKIPSLHEEGPYPHVRRSRSHCRYAGRYRGKGFANRQAGLYCEEAQEPKNQSKESNATCPEGPDPWDIQACFQSLMPIENCRLERFLKRWSWRPLLILIRYVCIVWSRNTCNWSCWFKTNVRLLWPSLRHVSLGLVVNEVISVAEVRRDHVSCHREKYEPEGHNT